jgi:hypothetical protein
MNIPNFVDAPLIDKSGSLTEIWKQILMQIFSELQNKASEEGVIMPQQSSTNITTLSTEKSIGAVIYDSTSDQMKACFKKIIGGTTVGEFKQLLTAAAGGLSPGSAVMTNSSGDLITGNVSSTELGYLDNVTSPVQTQLNGKEPTITAGTSSQYWRGDKTWQTLDTSIVPENINLYYTDARARASISSSATGLAYTPATGVFSLTTNYVIPTTTEESNWNSAYSDTLAATALNTASTIVKRSSAGRTAVSLQDNVATPVLSLDHNNRNLCSTSGVKTLGWGGANLEVYNDSGGANFSFERSTGRLSMVGLILNGEATLSKYNSVKSNVAFSGIWAASQTKELQIQIIGSVVTILFPSCLATATTASYISATLPSPYYPGSETVYLFIPRTVDNGVDSTTPSLLTIDIHGALKIYNGTGNFTGSGSSGFRSFCLTFHNA